MIKYIRLFVATIGLLMSMEAYSQASLTPPQKKRSHKTQQNYRRNQTGKPGVGISDGHEWVDLGLPSGLKWATCNVGASSPEEYGNYYAWGEIEPKSDYYSDCPTHELDCQQLFDKNFIDEAGNLSMTHDAARQNWGDGWRMPTRHEIDELAENVTAVERITYNSVTGVLLISKKNGNSLFFPAAGYCSENSKVGAEVLGYYWSSTPCEDDTWSSYCVTLDADIECSLDFRQFGCPVRPVTE